MTFFDMSKTSIIRTICHSFCSCLSTRFSKLKLTKEEKFFRNGRKKLDNEINIVRLLRSFREHKLVVKSLIDPSKYNLFKS